MTVERYPSATPDGIAIGLNRDRDDFVIKLAGELDLCGVTLVCPRHPPLRAERLASSHDRGFVIVRGPEQVQRIFEIAGIADSLAFTDG